MAADPREKALPTHLPVRRLSRRDFLARATALGLSGSSLVAFLAACGGPAAPPPQSAGGATVTAPTSPGSAGATASTAPGVAAPAGSPTAPTGAAVKKGGTLTVSMIGDATLNPFTWPGQLPTVLVAKNVFSTLVKYSAADGFTPVPDLATKWSMSEDGKVWTFTLRDNVKWHDGKPFSAADVKFTLDNILSKDVRALFKSALTGVTEVNAVDPTTVTIATKEPVGSLPILLGYNIAIAPRHLLEGQDLNTLADYVRKPVGTGPFKVKEIVSGDRVTLTANEDYFEGRPNIDTLVYKVVPDINTVVAQLRTGELDMAAVEPENMQALKGVDRLNFVTALEPNTFAIYLNNSRPPFDDARVRRALTMAIDRRAIVQQILLGEAVLATSAYSPAFGDYYNKAIQPYPYDVDKAAALMKEAGFTKTGGKWVKEGRPLAFGLLVDKGNPTREQIALVAQQFWQDFGATVTVDVQEWAVYLRQGNARPGEYDTRTGWRITAPDPDKTSEYHSTGTNNHYAYSNPRADKLLEQGRMETDRAKRIQIYHELQQVLYDDAPVCWLYYPNGILAVNKRVKNLPKLGIRDALLYVHQISVE